MRKPKQEWVEPQKGSIVSKPAEYTADTVNRYAGYYFLTIYKIPLENQAATQGGVLPPKLITYH